MTLSHTCFSEVLWYLLDFINKSKHYFCLLWSITRLFKNNPILSRNWHSFPMIFILPNLAESPEIPSKNFKYHSINFIPCLQSSAPTSHSTPSFNFPFLSFIVVSFTNEIVRYLESKDIYLPWSLKRTDFISWFFCCFLQYFYIISLHGSFWFINYSGNLSLASFYGRLWFNPFTQLYC